MCYKLRWRSSEHRRLARGLGADAISEVYDEPKWVLRRAVGDLLPEQILTRKKVGFPVPLGRWLSGPLRVLARDLLLDRTARQRGIVSTRAIERLLQTPAPTWRQGMQIWLLLNLELFFRRHISRGSLRGPA
jgi:asparagine synthase (glutamine-hydrolysing)